MQIHAGKVQIPNGDVSSKGPTACDTRLSDFKKCRMNSAERLKMSRTLQKVEASYSTPCGHLSQSGGNAISHGFSLHQAACGYARSGPSSSPSTGMRRKCAAFRAVNVNPSLSEPHPQNLQRERYSHIMSLVYSDRSGFAPMCLDLEWLYLSDTITPCAP